MRTFILTILLSLVSASALAQTAPSTGGPIGFQNAAQYSRVGAPIWGHYHSVTTGTRPVYNNGNADTNITGLRMFKWGALINVSCKDVATFCWVQTTTVTLGTGTSDGQVVDTTNTPDGAGACFRVEAGVSRDATVIQSIFKDANHIAARTSYCGGAATTTMGWPCRVDGDCSAGTCTSTPVSRGQTARGQITGAFLVSTAPVATNCFISEEN